MRRFTLARSLRPAAPLRAAFALLACLALALAACADATSSAQPPSPGDDGTDGGGDPGDVDGDGDGDGDGDPPDVMCFGCDGGTELFPELPEAGSVELELHPSAGVGDDEERLVAFAAPLPPGVAAAVDELVLTDAGGAEIPTDVRELARWRTMGEESAPTSVRSALFFARASFPGGEPLALQLHWGAERSSELGPQGDPRATWVEAQGHEYNLSIDEPAALATFPPAWLGACLLRGRIAPAGEVADLDWFDEALLGYAGTAVNDVAPGVTQQIDVNGDFSVWLFDRALTLFGVYARTGEVEWLRRAHRASQFYAAHVDGDGYFDMKSYDDLKYSYGASLVTDYLLTGDATVLDVVDRVAQAGSYWHEAYDPGLSFWTERHTAYALLAAITAWEVTGDPAHGARARTLVENSLDHVLDPPSGWSPDGCLLHGGGQPVCSPWMTALFSEAVWRYYVHSRDPAALELLAEIGDFVASIATYVGGEGLDRRIPWYLVSSVRQVSNGGPWLDMEHACDVGGMALRGAWARRELGGDPSSVVETALELLETCQFVLDYWHRPGGPDAGLAEWRLTPPRKFNWWFGTTVDLPWLYARMTSDL